jgi:hypothetical protein
MNFPIGFRNREGALVTSVVKAIDISSCFGISKKEKAKKYHHEVTKNTKKNKENLE